MTEFSLNPFDHSTGTNGGEIPQNTAIFKDRTNQNTIQSFEGRQKVELRRGPKGKTKHFKCLVIYRARITIYNMKYWQKQSFKGLQKDLLEEENGENHEWNV